MVRKVRTGLRGLCGSHQYALDDGKTGIFLACCYNFISYLNFLKGIIIVPSAFELLEGKIHISYGNQSNTNQREAESEKYGKNAFNVRRSVRPSFIDSLRQQQKNTNAATTYDPLISDVLIFFDIPVAASDRNTHDDVEASPENMTMGGFLLPCLHYDTKHLGSIYIPKEGVKRGLGDKWVVNVRKPKVRAQSLLCNRLRL